MPTAPPSHPTPQSRKQQTKDGVCAKASCVRAQVRRLFELVVSNNFTLPLIKGKDLGFTVYPWMTGQISLKLSFGRRLDGALLSLPGLRSTGSSPGVPADRPTCRMARRYGLCPRAGAGRLGHRYYQDISSQRYRMGMLHRNAPPRAILAAWLTAPSRPVPRDQQIPGQCRSRLDTRAQSQRASSLDSCHAKSVL
jgi:hypothetical protein